MTDASSRQRRMRVVALVTIIALVVGIGGGFLLSVLLGN